MKIEIKNRWSGSVLFSIETDSLKLAVEAAVKSSADLRGADLRGADLQGADLRGADLQGADLQGADLQGADLRGADLQDADLQGADWQGADWQGAGLREIRTRKIDMQKLTEWNACENGKEWVRANIGESVSCADLYAHGKDNYLVWLEGRVLMMLSEREKE